MTKIDWAPLLQPGMHMLTLEQLESAALGGDLATERRIELFARLAVFLNNVAATGCDADVWIDGSFTTKKPDPSDIDIALFIHEESLAMLNTEAQEALYSLLDRPVAMERFGLDLYVELFGDFHRAAYWRGVFGFCHDETTPKGIAVLHCAP